MPAFDIFKQDDDGALIWCEAAATLEAAKARVAILAALSRVKRYIVLNQATQQQLLIDNDGLSSKIAVR